ncbi:MAG: type VII secretion protein EccCa, partial [Gordonia sp. (in: high G+C Gram-positive bacteria)]
MPRKPLEISAPPTIEDGSAPQEGVFLRLAMPIMAGGGMMLMMASSGSLLRMLAGAGFVGVAVLMGISMYVYSKTGHRKRTESKRRAYLRFLARTAAECTDEIDLQRQVQERLHPRPLALLDLIDNPARIYERRRHDADFAVVRIGTGPGPLARGVRLERVSDPAAEPDAIAAAHLDRTQRLAEHIDGLPLTVELRGVVSVVGERDATHAVLRAALTQLIALHAPEDVVIHLCVEQNLADYRWLLPAPHLHDAEQFDGPVHRRRISVDQAQLASALTPILTERFEELTKSSAAAPPMPSPLVVVVVDRADAATQQPLALLPPQSLPEHLGLCLVQLVRRRIDEPSEITCRVEISGDGRVTVEHPDVDEPDDLTNPAARARRLATGARRGALDSVAESLAATVARQLAPVRLAPEATPEAPLASTISIEKLLDIADIGAFDPEQAWQSRAIGDFLRVPFGVDLKGNPVFLDLKESALDGHGPHGLCIGATGSGKSEVLRTLVLAQAISHPPERLAFVLVDYKGGAAFHGLDRLPHTAAIVDNLADDDGLVDRLHDALFGETQRRQRVLQAAAAKNIFDYNERRDAGAALEPLPNLFVVIDEFGEILAQKPLFVELFVQIGRIGRSIGIHLLLASQRLEEGRLRGLESHLSYRIGLRTFSAMESKTVIGTNDAHTLPALPGSGYLKVDPDIYTRFKAAYVSGRYGAARSAKAGEAPSRPILDRTPNRVADLVADQQPSRDANGSPAQPGTPFDQIVLHAAVDRLAATGRRTAQIWLPPLPSELRFETLVGPLMAVDGRGLQCLDRSLWSTRRFPIGLLDDPARQWQGTFTADTADANILIIGAPQTGKSTTLRAMICGSAITHTPREIAWYLIDAAGSALADLDAMPHVGSVATRFDPDRIRRTVAEMTAELARREEIFAEYRISDAEHLRTLTAAEHVPVSSADWYLVIDGFITFANDYEDLVADVTDLAVRGLGYGLHVLIGANRLGDMRMNLHTNFAFTIEHRLNAAIDSTIDRTMQERIGRDERGRVLSPDGKLAQIMHPDAAGCAELAGVLTQAWTGPAAAPVRMLPGHITYPEIPAVERDSAITIGVDEAALAPVGVDLLGGEPHLLIFGDTEAGKTALLRTVIGDLVTRQAPTDLNLVVIDPRRALLEFTPQPPLKVYANTVDRAQVVFEQLHDYLLKRVPAADVTPAQLRDRSWWTGPEMVVIVDDYDILVPSTMAVNPLIAIAPLIPLARDIGLHLVIARRASGASRALFDPVLGSMRDNGASTVLLSGDRSEGQIFTKVYFEREPAGRGRLVRRNGTVTRAQFAEWVGDLAV